MEAVLNFIKDLLGDSAFIGFIAVVVLVFLVWWDRGIKEKMSKVDVHEKYMNEFRDAVALISNLPCATHTHEIERYNTENHDMNTRITKVEISIEYLQRSLDTFTKNKLILDKFTESHCQLSISEEGRKMIGTHWHTENVRRKLGKNKKTDFTLLYCRFLPFYSPKVSIY